MRNKEETRCELDKSGNVLLIRKGHYIFSDDDDPVTRVYGIRRPAVRPGFQRVRSIYAMNKTGGALYYKLVDKEIVK